MTEELITPEESMIINGLTLMGEWITCTSTGRRHPENKKLIVETSAPGYMTRGTIEYWKYPWEGTSIMRK